MGRFKESRGIYLLSPCIEPLAIPAIHRVAVLPVSYGHEVLSTAPNHGGQEAPHGPRAALRKHQFNQVHIATLKAVGALALIDDMPGHITPPEIEGDVV